MPHPDLRNRYVIPDINGFGCGRDSFLSTEGIGTVQQVPKYGKRHLGCQAKRRGSRDDGIADFFAPVQGKLFV
jgi:hypothetical protein